MYNFTQNKGNKNKNYPRRPVFPTEIGNISKALDYTLLMSLWVNRPFYNG
jgi:hypothetical protein